MEKVPLKPSSSDLALLSLPPDIQKQARAVARIDPIGPLPLLCAVGMGAAGAKCR